MENLAGKTVRGYLLHDMIGEGGFGAVYRATQTTVDREVAIKVILPQYANRPEFIRKFEAEARLVARLEHPHIVPLFDYWRDPEGAYLVLRWMKGGTLRESLRKDGPWSARATAKLFTQVAAALTVAHRNNVVHRDVKPANILLDEEKMGYLSDFGIAMDTMETEKTHAGAAGSGSGSSSSGGVTGSAGYISPEQINMMPVTPRSDIYSMTIVLYEMIAGRHPYPDARSAIALFIKHTSEPLPMLEDFPEAVNRVLQKGAAKNPEERYSDMLQMAQEFKTAVAGSDLPAVIGEDGLFLEDFDTTSILASVKEAGEIDNPYKGLRAFQESDAEDFNGREILIGRLLDRMVEDHEMMRFLAVIGPSGSGKSSVVKAGVIPALRRGEILGSETWFIVEMLPGASPFQELTDAILSVTVNPIPDLENRLRSSNTALRDIVHEALPPDDDSELVLAIDQFEEVFTQGDDHERDMFLQNIYEAVMAPDSRLRVMVTMRADFYDRPLMVQKFSALMQQRTEVVVPMTIEELERAITAPARRVKVFFQQGLAAAIVSEVAEQPGVLPMLQYALTELFERREGQILTLAVYQELGGVLGALARRADEIYVQLDKERQEVTRQLFLRLVTPGEGTEDTRRRALESELLSAARDARMMKDIIDMFGKFRLLTADRDPISRSPTIEVAHEALIREWKRLRQWLDEAREDLRLQRLLTAAATEWDTSNRDKSFLLRGGRLVQFEEWIERTTINLTKLDRDYFSASLEERQRLEAEEALRLEKERQLELRARQRARIFALVMFGAGVVGILLAVFALNESNQANIARARSDADATVAVIAQNDALVEADNAATAQRDAEVAATVAYDAQQEAQLAATDVALALGEADENANRASTQAANAATAGAEAVVQATNASFANETAVFQANVASTANAIAQTAAAVALNSENIAVTQGAIAQENARDAQTQAANAAFAQGTAASEAEISQSLALAASSGQLAGSNSPLALRLALEANNVPDPSVLAQRALIGIVFNAPRHRFVSTHGSINSIALLPLDNRAITGNGDGTVTIWDIETAAILETMSGHTDEVNQVAVNPGGQRAVSASQDGTVIVWDLSTFLPVQTFTGHAGSPVNTVAFNPTGTQVASGADDGRVLIWNASSGSLVRDIPPSSANPVNSVAFSAEGRYLVIASNDLLRVWNIGDNIPHFFEAAGNDTRSARSAVFSPRGEYILSSGIANSSAPELWDTDNLSDPSTRLLLVRRLPAHNAPVNYVNFNFAGDKAVSASDDFAVIVSDVETGTVLKRYTGHTSRVTSAVFSRRDDFVLSASSDGIMFYWDVTASTQPPVVYGSSTGTDESVASVMFTPGGNTLGVMDQGRVSIWDSETRETILTRNLGKPDVPQSEFMLSPLATEDNLIALWGTTDLQLINLSSGETLLRITAPEERAWVNDTALSPDGKLVIWGGGYFFRERLNDFTRAGILRLFDTETGNLLREFDVRQTVVLPPSAPEATPEVVLAEGTNASVTAVAFSPDMRYLVSGIEDGRLYLWDMATGAKIREFDGHSGSINQIIFTRDGSQMLTASSDRAIILWDVEAGSLLRRYSGHTGAVNGIALDRNEIRFVSASEDRTLRLWDVESGDTIQVFEDQEDPVTTVAFNPDNTAALAGTLLGDVTLRRIDTPESLRLWAVDEGNRFIHEFTCAEQEQFRIQPLCVNGLTATPTPPVTATPAPTQVANSA